MGRPFDGREPAHAFEPHQQPRAIERGEDARRRFLGRRLVERRGRAELFGVGRLSTTA